MRRTDCRFVDAAAAADVAADPAVDPPAVAVPRRERGAAIITALLVVTLAAVLVNALFYRMNVSIRSIENRASLAQTRWVERAAVDWARVVLASDLRTTTVDHPIEVWAQPIPETKLDATVTGGQPITDDSRDAFLAGQIVDAQARYNVNNLVDAGGRPDNLQRAAFRRLLVGLGLPEQLESALVIRLMNARPTVVDNRVVPATLPPLMRLTDLSDLPGFDSAALQKLQPHAIVLPEPSKINLHTASAEVIAAVLDISLGQAKRFVRNRETKPYGSVDLAIDSAGGQKSPEIRQLVDVSTNWFIIGGLIRYDRIESLTETLLHRTGNQASQSVKVVWQHRN
ncbi:MAG: type II secretion system minor pseudopilin GspK [Lautropia sp.]